MSKIRTSYQAYMQAKCRSNQNEVESMVHYPEYGVSHTASVIGKEAIETFNWIYSYTRRFWINSKADMFKSRRMRWAGHVARMEEGRDVHKVLVGKTEGKRPLGRPRRRWEDNIKLDLEEVGRGCGDRMGLAQDRDKWWALVSTVMNFGVP